MHQHRNSAVFISRKKNLVKLSSVFKAHTKPKLTQRRLTTNISQKTGSHGTCFWTILYAKKPEQFFVVSVNVLHGPIFIVCVFIFTKWLFISVCFSVLCSAKIVENGRYVIIWSLQIQNHSLFNSKMKPLNTIRFLL